MQTHSFLQRRANTESSDRVVAHIKPRSWGDEIHQQPQTVQPQNTGFDFKNADWFSHDPGPRSPVRVFNTIQAKLKVGAPNDQYEQEADRVAEQVMSTPDAATHQAVQREDTEESAVQTKPLAATITPIVQREMAPEEEDEDHKRAQPKLIQRDEALEEEDEDHKRAQPKLIQREEALEEEDEDHKRAQPKLIQREEALEEEDEDHKRAQPKLIQREEALKEEDEDHKPVQAQSELQRKASPAGFQAQPRLEQQLDSSKGGGSPLPDDVRTFMEPRFGADFSQVRVHTGSDAVQMNRDLHAQAFTHKQDVYFGAGKAPTKDALTAHELTHVVQQTEGVQTKQASKQPINSSCVPETIQRREVCDDKGVCRSEKETEPNSSQQGATSPPKGIEEIQGRPMYEVLSLLNDLSQDILNDEEKGKRVGGSRLILAMRAVRAKKNKGLVDFLANNKPELDALPSDQFVNILSFLGSNTPSLSTDNPENSSGSTFDDEKRLAQLNSEMAVEIAKAAADIAGILDPTPISDGISASISLAQGDYASAGLSVVAMVPYVGDAVGKPLKLARNAAKLAKLAEEIGVLTKASKIVGKKASQVIVDAGVKTVEKVVAETASKAPKIAKAEKLLNALKDFAGKTFRFGAETFQLDKKGMQHILERHHPNFWDGSEKAAQTFFDRKMGITDVADAVEKVLQQNRETLIRRGSRGMYQVEGTHNGVKYVLGVNQGRIGQFYPK
jgi:Domain of unknown function (DUF4157)